MFSRALYVWSLALKDKEYEDGPVVSISCVGNRARDAGVVRNAAFFDG